MAERMPKILLSLGLILTSLSGGYGAGDWPEELLMMACPAAKKDPAQSFWEELFGFNPMSAEGWLLAGLSWNSEEDHALEATAQPETGQAADADASEEESIEGERFSGYPVDRYVTVRTEEAVEVEDIRDQYPERYITQFDSTKWLYAYSSSVLKVDPSYIDGERFMEVDLTTELSGEEPVILIFHTHGTEGYIGAETGGVHEVGEYLAEILSEQYGISVLHHTAVYDAEGTNGAYTRMAAGVEKILEEYPSIEVMIDLHRDGVDESVHLVQTVGESEAAQIMLVNGICQQLDADGELVPIEYLSNPYLEENLALSFRMKMAADVLYPGYMRHLYLARWQYSTYMRPLSLLLEVGAQTNTIEEAKAAMEPFAKVLYTVLTGNG